MQNHVRHASPVSAGTFALALVLFGSGIAAAQTPPGAPAEAPQPPPTYATPARDAQIRGRIGAITGKYTLTVLDDRGYVDNVTLHPGTVINPTGLRLAPGMPVTILGSNAGASFTANVIDAPYTVTLVQPTSPGFGFGFGFGPYGRFGPAGLWW